ncbi:hypothetical protein FGB62_139g224 [Gracilaria domingensis]|nr:hypothetical protein FGB62_139g224 [Gracilaria domingensis]
MKFQPLRAGASRNHASDLFTLAVFVLVGIACGQEIQCTSSVNKNEPPTFLCGALIRLRRETDCSRNLYFLSDIQRISNVIVLLNETRVRDFRLFGDDENSATIEFETEPSTSNSLYTIRYSVFNGVLRFNRRCGGTGGRSFPGDNVIRWRSGVFEEAVDQIIVEFESETDGKLSFVGLDDQFESESASGRVRFIAHNVTGEIEAYVRETGAELCDENLVCDDGGLGAWIIFLIVAGSVLGIVSVIIVLYLVRRKKARSGAEWNVGMDTADVEAR